MSRTKEINIKMCRYYFFDDLINIKNIDPNQIKIVKKSYKIIIIYYVGYITIKNFSYVNVNSVNPLYIIVNKIDGYIEETNANKYITLVSTDKNEDTLKKYTELWNKI